MTEEIDRTDWVYTTFKITGNPKELLKLSEEVFDGECYDTLTFSKFVPLEPIDEDLSEVEQQEEHSLNAISAWGTVYDPVNFTVEHNEQEIVGGLFTVATPPDEFFRTIKEAYPKCGVSISYVELDSTSPTVITF